MFKSVLEQISQRNTWITLTFCFFVLIQFAFAAIYFLLYRKDRGNFSYNLDILKSQIEARTAEFEELTAQTQVLQELLQSLERGVGPVATSSSESLLILDSGHKYTMTYVSRSAPPVAAPPGRILEIVSPQGQKILSTDALSYSSKGRLPRRPSDRERWQFQVSNVARVLGKKLDVAAKRMASLAAPDPDIWSYWDFLYFSTIIQTTVGLGDILPNSTAVRLVVAGQVMLGYGLLVVVLNVVLGGG